MTRKILLLLVVCFTSASSTLLALGLGEIKLKSGLNQPLDAEITLLSVRNESNDQLRGLLGSHDDFERTGIERVYFLSKIRFQTITKPNGQQVLKLTTEEAVKEPFLNFLVNLEWPNGKLLREYTLLLDPPVFDDAPEAIVAPVIRESRPEPAPTKTITRQMQRKPQWQGEIYGPTSSSDTLWSIAAKVRPSRAVTIQQAMITIFEANPEAFMRGNINNLKRGAELKVPDSEVFNQLSQREAMSMIARHNENWRTGKRSEPRVVMDTSSDSGYKSTTQTSNSEQGRLSLSTDSSETGIGGSSVSDIIVEEENEILKQQNDSLIVQSESDAEKIQQLERLLELKNEQLANMQNREEAVPEEVQPKKVDTTTEIEPLSKPIQTEVSTPSVTDNASKNSTIDNVLSGQYNLYMAIGGGVILLLLIVSIMRRRRDDVDYNTAISSNKSDVTPSSTPTESYSKSADEVLAGTNVDDSETVEDILVEKDIADTAAVSDPLGEADIYLAYGKFGQAESLLLAAIAEDPERIELSTKLLECYAEMNDHNKFESQVNSLETAMSSDSELAKNIEDLYQTAWPEGELFAADSEEEFSTDIADDEMTTEDSLDADTISDNIEDVPSVEDVFGEELDTVDDDDDNSLEIDESLLVDEESDDEHTESDTEVSSDDIDTQLDLARAYIEMGDHEGTREIISEILESGSDEQCSEAQKILDSMED